MSVQIINADVFAGLAQLEDESVHCCVTSPPYWGLRDYGVEGQIGLEPTLGEWLAQMVAVFREVRRVLRPDGTCWVNIGDAYAAGHGGSTTAGNYTPKVSAMRVSGMKDRDDVDVGGWGKSDASLRIVRAGIKAKDLIGQPWRLAFALQDDGWWLRQDIIWHKPNPMPESCTDRCTKAHEYLFLLTKSARYFYDADNIREGRTSDEDANSFRGGSYVAGEPGKRAKTGNRRVKIPGGGDLGDGGHGTVHRHGRTSAEYQDAPIKPGRNKRSVWTIATEAYPEAHFATFPEELPETCIKAGCPIGGTVLDPFGGAGTTGLVADKLGRNAVLIELNPEYAAMAERRIRGSAPLFAQVVSSKPEGTEQITLV